MYSSQLLPTSSNRTMIFQVSGEILMLWEDGSLLQSIIRIVTLKKKSHNLIKQFRKLPSACAVTGLQYEYLTCFDQNKEGRREHHFTNKKIQVCEEMAFALLSSPSSVLEQEFKALSTTFFHPWNNRDGKSRENHPHTGSDIIGAMDQHWDTSLPDLFREKKLNNCK